MSDTGIKSEALVEPAAAAVELSFKADALRWLIEDAPQFLTVVLVSAAIALLGVWGLSHVGHTSMSGARVVSFDVVKLGNAERAIASGLLGKQNADSSDNAMLLMQVSKRVTGVIHQEARGALVIVKQAVVDGDVPDITDAVLKTLGLPTDVPDIDPMRYLTTGITTDLGFSVQAVREQRQGAAQAAANQIKATAANAQGAAAMVP